MGDFAVRGRVDESFRDSVCFTIDCTVQIADNPYAGCTKTLLYAITEHPYPDCS